MSEQRGKDESKLTGVEIVHKHRGGTVRWKKIHMGKEQETMFQKMLKKLREQKDLTQIELSKVLGIKRSTIALYESSGSNPTLSNLISIADYFGVSLDYLTGRSQINDSSCTSFEGCLNLKPASVLLPKAKIYTKSITKRKPDRVGKGITNVNLKFYFPLCKRCR